MLIMIAQSQVSIPKLPTGQISIHDHSWLLRICKKMSVFLLIWYRYRKFVETEKKIKPSPKTRAKQKPSNTNEKSMSFSRQQGRKA